MITGILSKLDIASATGGGDIAGFGNINTITNLFDMSSMIPPYLLQISVGIYLIEIIFILTGTLVVIDSGDDKLEKTNKTGINLKAGIGLYFITALISTIALFFLTSIVLSGLV
jgi:hypothetical protein